MAKTITLTGTPANPQDAATKGYVDTRVSTLVNAAPGTYAIADYVFAATNAYPARPTARTDITVVWRGPTSPASGMLAGDEWKVKTS